MAGAQAFLSCKSFRLRKVVAATAGGQCIGQQTSNGHGANTAGHWCDCTGLVSQRGKFNITHSTGVKDGIHNHSTRFNPVGLNQLRNTNRANSLKSQAEVVVASMAAGLTASANLNFGGFDTHGNHDANAYPDLGDLLEGIHFMMVALQYAGIADRTTVVVGSDFGRTPYYNSGNGKDHWPVTSMLVLRPESSGGRVFGASTADFLSQPVNLTTGQPDAAGEILTPQHVNRAIRNLMGVGSSSLADNYPLNVPDFRIFG